MTENTRSSRVGALANEKGLAVDQDAAHQAPASPDDPRAVLALYVTAFFNELRRCGVRELVVSPGSRSTPLAVAAAAGNFDLYLAVDERSAGFLALGLAKGFGRPVALICTSGTAVGNYLPAVMEAAVSRVPLIVLSSDRPARLQGVGAPQTCDQVKIFGDYVRLYRTMPQPACDPQTIAYVRQMALEAAIAAAGSHDASFGAGGGSLVDAAPVHLNFPFDKPLIPDLRTPGVFTLGAHGRSDRDLPPRIGAWSSLGPHRAADFAELLKGRTAVAICGERSVAGGSQADQLLDFARCFQIPLIADPLSELRCFDDELIISNYDSFLAAPDAALAPELVIRFGRWPVSRHLTEWAQSLDALSIVVDVRDTRDFTCSTDIFVRTTPVGFASSILKAAGPAPGERRASERQSALARRFHEADAAAGRELLKVRDLEGGFEGVFVDELLRCLPEGSLLFAGNSTSIRCVDSFLQAGAGFRPVLCNRGLNGIDGTIACAIGAAQRFPKTAVVLGDLALQHDLGSLALQGEMIERERQGFIRPPVIILCLNNHGGAIFDTLDEVTSSPVRERLFLTPQQVDFQAAAAAFGVPAVKVRDRAGFREAWRRFSDLPGLSLIEAELGNEAIRERFAPYWHLSLTPSEEKGGRS